MSGSGSERWNTFGICCDSYLGSESVTEAGGTARWNWQKRNGGKTVICLTSVAHKVLSQVDGWRADAWRRVGAGVHLNKATHGWDSSPIRASHRKPVSHIPPHLWLLTIIASFACKRKKNSPNWNSSWFQETGPQVAWPCLRLFTGFMLLLLLQPTLESSVLEAYLWQYVYFEIDEDVASHPATMNCPFCSGIVWQMETVTQTEATKVTERCCKLSWGTPVPLLRVNPKLAFYSSLIYFLFISMYEAACCCFDYITFSSITLLPHISKRGKITWLVLVQSQAAHWHCNWVKQKYSK